jgi:hypothetical protein
MERNVAIVREHTELHDAARQLAARAVAMARVLQTTEVSAETVMRAGRKASAGAMGG